MVETFIYTIFFFSSPEGGNCSNPHLDTLLQVGLRLIPGDLSNIGCEKVKSTIDIGEKSHPNEVDICLLTPTLSTSTKLNFTI